MPKENVKVTEKIRELAMQGKTKSEIAVELKSTYNNVAAICFNHKIETKRSRRDAESVRLITDQVKELAPDNTYSEIADKLGITYAVVTSICNRNNIVVKQQNPPKLDKPAPTRFYHTGNDKKELIKLIRQLSKKHTVKEISGIVNLTESHIYKLCARNGIKTLKKT